MEIETSLINLEEAVQNGQKLSAGSSVVLPMGDEAEIYGFIAIDGSALSPYVDMPPLGECMVFSNRVIFHLDKQLHRYPIFSSVSLPNENKYGVYLLYVPRFLNLSEDWKTKYYIETMCREKPHSKVSNIDGIQLEEGVAYYYPKTLDLFFESRSKFRAIGTGFVVITRRLSTVTDSIKYEIFDSHSVKIERCFEDRISVIL